MERERATPADRCRMRQRNGLSRPGIQFDTMTHCPQCHGLGSHYTLLTEEMIAAGIGMPDSGIALVKCSECNGRGFTGDSLPAWVSFEGQSIIEPRDYQGRSVEVAEHPRRRTPGASWWFAQGRK